MEKVSDEKQKENKMNNNERIARWLGWTVDKFLPPTWYFKDGDSVMRVKDFKPDTDITLWHGEDGLLSKIEERGEEFAESFIFELDLDLFGTENMLESDLFSAIRATPEQLTMALAAAINKDRL